MMIFTAPRRAAAKLSHFRPALIGAAAFALLAGQGPAQAPAAAQPTAFQCSVAGVQAVALPDTTITAAAWVDAPVRHCRIDGYVTATNPGPNRNHFRLQLPVRAAWNGRYYFIGVGGSGGSVPTDSQTPTGNPIVAGFAVAGTDKGHQGPPLNWSFNSDPVKALDNAHRGAHVTTVAAQHLTRVLYGTKEMFRYHTGCSGGGDMGLRAMQDHPEDYDGVLLGVPVGRHPDPRKDGVARNYATMLREVMREPGAWVPPAKRAFAEKKALEACDIGDGARDEMIWDHRQCRFDFTELTCKAGDGPECLTAPQARTLNNLIRETAFPISNMDTWGFYLGNNPPPWDPSPARENVAKSAAGYIILNNWARTHLEQPERDVMKDPLTAREIDLILERQASTALNVPGGRIGFEPFIQSGGKAIFYVGVSDPCCSNVAMEQYMIDSAKLMGRERLDQSAKLYEVPGWGHCGGGTGPTDGVDRMLQALIDWVERDRAPVGIVMHRGPDRAQLLFSKADGSAESGVGIPAPTGPSRDFLVCPFPMTSVFDSSKADVPGAVYDARNWTCRAAPWPVDKARI
jgi:feruloyl esterase